MNKVELKPGVYSVGSVDWNIREFHGYSTHRGATYNAYLIIDEKVTLIDTVKEPFKQELIDRISEIIDPTKIDYVVSNHVEMDHSGAIPAIMNLAKNAVLVTSSPSGLKGLKAHFGDEYNYLPVKAGESLSLGKRSLTFISTPMLHWPDNMVTYCPEEKILFSNDAFGQHFASNKPFDDQVDLAIVLEEAKKYYANILMPFGLQAIKAVESVKTLDIDIIAPSHGIIWRSHIKEILEQYDYYTSAQMDDKAVIVYDSMWHSTEKIAHSILEGFSRAGISANLYDLKVNDISDIMVDILKAKYVAVGSPTLNNMILPTVGAFLTYMKGLAPKGRKAVVFGSYGWGGQSVPILEEELKKMGFDIIVDPIKIAYIPSKEQLDEIEEKIASL